MPCADLVSNKWVRIAAGYFVSVVVGHWFISAILNRLWSAIEPRQLRSRFLTGWLGIVERTLYTGAFFMGAPQAIAVWLALKVAAQWHTGQTRRSPTENIWLIGTAFAIGFGFLGAWIALGHLPTLSQGASN